MAGFTNDLKLYSLSVVAVPVMVAIVAVPNAMMVVMIGVLGLSRDWNEKQNSENGQ
jgi:hypothetical protein